MGRFNTRHPGRGRGTDRKDRNKLNKEIKNKKRSSNGEVSFKLDAKHLKNGMDQPLSQLVGFRMYLHFHLHAMKINLHSRMRKRVEAMELIIKQARRDEEAPKTYKEKHGGET